MREKSATSEGVVSKEAVSEGKDAPAPAGGVGEVFRVFLRLGLTSFGGPIAHLGYFRAELLERRRWLGEAEYADIIALCQFLPGPASSQVAVSLGILRAGLLGGFAAWAAFSAPSAALLILFAYARHALVTFGQGGALAGLKIVAVAVVAQALWGMGRTLAPDRARATLAVAAAWIALLWPGSLGQIAAILLGAGAGLVLYRTLPPPEIAGRLSFALSRPLAVSALILFFLLLFGLPLVAPVHPLAAVIAAFYRAGSLVFGGGHVVLPLLEQAVVPPGWVDEDTFLAGYGAAQAVPGPLFTFAAYLGAAMRPAPNGVAGGILTLAAIYLPSFLLLIGILPFWDQLRRKSLAQAALRGVNAAVVGVLLAALFTPVWTSAIHGAADFGLGITAFLALVFWRLPPWLVVIAGAALRPLLG